MTENGDDVAQGVVPEPVKPETLDEIGADVSTGSLFEAEEQSKVDENKPYKLDTNQGAIKTILFLLALSALVILAVMLLYKPEIDKAGYIMSLR